MNWLVVLDLLEQITNDYFEFPPYYNGQKQSRNRYLSRLALMFMNSKMFLWIIQ